MKNECNKVGTKTLFLPVFAFKNYGVTTDQIIGPKVIGFYHSNSENGKYTKAQKRFVKIEGGKTKYLGNKRFIKPICLL